MLYFVYCVHSIRLLRFLDSIYYFFLFVPYFETSVNEEIKANPVQVSGFITRILNSGDEEYDSFNYYREYAHLYAGLPPRGTEGEPTANESPSRPSVQWWEPGGGGGNGGDQR